MSIDFWAGYVSGAVGIIVGSPLDIIKVQLQSGQRPSLALQTPQSTSRLSYYAQLTRGASAPILGYGALNAILFVSYNRALSNLEPTLTDFTDVSNVSLSKIWGAGAVGGLASWIISAPTELVKCRAQLNRDGQNSWNIARQVWKQNGARGFYLGGGVTSIRDAVGYGFYFWSYEICKRLIITKDSDQEAIGILLSGGIAGVVTWASVFPLDVIKTRIQCPYTNQSGGSPQPGSDKLTAFRVARQIYHQEGKGAFFRGLGVCSSRAFIVNAFQWAIYEWIMGLPQSQSNKSLEV